MTEQLNSNVLEYFWFEVTFVDVFWCAVWLRMHLLESTIEAWECDTLVVMATRDYRNKQLE